MFSVLNTISETGIGLYSGEPVKLTLSPSVNAGIWFKNKNGNIQKLHPDNIVVDNHNTAIKYQDGTTVRLIEHILAAVYAKGIANITISVTGDEVPLFDGSAMGYISLMEGLVLKKNKRDKVAYLTKSVEVRDGEYYIKVSPNSSLLFESSISFPETPIGYQSMKYEFSPETFIEKISMARTFGVIDNLELAQQYFKGSNLDNTLIITNNKQLNKERTDQEFIKHKILDSLGDLRVFEYPLIMKYTAFGSSHKLNNILLKKIIEEDAFEVIEVKNYVFEKDNNKIKAKSLTY